MQGIWYNLGMNKKDTLYTLSVRFNPAEKTIITELKEFYGLSSDNEVLRFALRAAKREMQRQGLKPKIASPHA
jgi:hypothetical protein